MAIIIRDNFLDYLKTKTDKDLDKYLFKIEQVGDCWTTQDCKPFRSSYYKQIAWLGEFATWLEMQPEIYKRYGYCEEITEIWYRQDVGKLKDRPSKQPKYILIWSKEKGWLGTQHFKNMY